MPTKPVQAHKVKRGKLIRFRVITPIELNGGRRKVSYFRNERAARMFASQLQTQRESPSARFFSLGESTQQSILRAVALMGDRAGEIEDAASEWMRKVESTSELKLLEAFQIVWEAKEKSGKRDRYVKALKNNLKLFASSFGPNSLLRDVRPHHIEDWLNNPEWTQSTRRGRLIDLSTAFAFHLKRGGIVSNPASAVEKPEPEDKAPGILTVDECKRLLQTCSEIDPAFVPFIAVQMFGGLRPIEAKRISKKAFRDGHIEIGSEVSKTHSRRLVTINPTLKRFLNGDYQRNNSIKRMLAVREKAQVNWSHDALRHSFVSYHYPIHGAAMTALESGHSESVLFKHYRELVPRSEAERFWKLGDEIPTNGV